MNTKIAIALLTLLLFLAGAALAQDGGDNYCKYVQETAQADGLRLRTPAATGGITQPNTGTAPQLYAGLTSSLSDYRKGKLTVEAARANCSLYKNTSAAQQGIQYAASYLEQQTLTHRIGLDETALAKINSLIDQNVKMIAAQSATKLSLYALQTAKARLVQDRANAQRTLAARFIPELPDVPLIKLVQEKQNAEEKNQAALVKVSRQENWDLRWEAGYHRTVNNSPGRLASPDGAYGGFTVLYNLGSKRVNQHLDAAAKNYGDWKREGENDVAQTAEELRQQLVDAIRVETNRFADLKTEQKSLDENLSLVQEVSTGPGITFANQLAADKLVLGVELKDSEYRLTSLRDYLAYNFEGQGRVSNTAHVSITFDDGFESAFKNAKPVLDRTGIKATWYIITKALGSKDYMTADQVKVLAADGQEIGAHTQTHPHLSTLTLDQQEREIVGSMQDLHSLGLSPVSFAYPYGEHNDDTLAAVQAAGFKTARTTDQSLSGRNPYLLQGYSITQETTFEDVEHAILQAQARGSWVILTFHRIDEDGNSMNASSKLLERIVDYLVKNHLMVTTVGGQ